ncbi:MAG: tetratricopeptide repeat protein [Nitrospirota bacterium]
MGFILKAIVFFFLFSTNAFAEETPAYELHISKGILALDTKEYSRAMEEFTAALKVKPDDPTANLYLGIAHYRSGKERDGERFLKKALSIDPRSPRTNLELGILYYNRGLWDESRDFMETAKSLDPGTEVATAAENYLKEMGKKEAAVKAKDWALSLTAGAQYDSNVILEPSDGTLPQGISNKHDWRAVLYFDGHYTPAISGKLRLGPTYSFYQSIHAELHDFNVQQYLPGVMASFSLNKYLFFRTDYSYEYTTVGGSGYLSAHSVAPVLTIAEGRGFFTLLRYQYQNKDFKDSELFANNSERDGSNNLFGIIQYVPAGIVTIRLSYAYDVDDTDKIHWAYKGHSGECSLSADFGEGWKTDLTGQYYRKDYRGDYPGTGTKRTDELKTFSVNLTKTMNKWLDITAGWLYEQDDSNIDIFEYERNITTFLLRVYI